MSTNGSEDLTVSLLHQMPRSGGTIIAKAIGCMDHVYLFSEVYPYPYNDRKLDYLNLVERRSYFPSQRVRYIDKDHFFDRDRSLAYQAWDWYSLIDKQEYEALLDRDFLYQVKFVARKIQNQNGYMVIRSWDAPDFFGILGFEKIYCSSVSSILSEELTISECSTVRHPVALYRSIKSREWWYGSRKINWKTYLYDFKKFADYATVTGFQRYEDICVQPNDSMNYLCDRLGIPFDENYMRKMSRPMKFSGDGDAIRSSKFNPPQPVERQADMAYQSIYNEIISTLGYDY